MDERESMSRPWIIYIGTFAVPLHQYVPYTECVLYNIWWENNLLWEPTAPIDFNNIKNKQSLRTSIINNSS